MAWGKVSIQIDSRNPKMARQTPVLLERLNEEFQDIVEAGKIERASAHRLEADDPHLDHLPRITFQSNRKHLGRLRQMVDVINAELGKPADSA